MESPWLKAVRVEGIEVRMEGWVMAETGTGTGVVFRAVTSARSGVGAEIETGAEADIGGGAVAEVGAGASLWAQV